MNTIRPTQPRSVSQTQTARTEERRERESAPSLSSPLDAFEAFNPMTYWANAMSASMSMFSPLGYGAMQGPLGY